MRVITADRDVCKAEALKRLRKAREALAAGRHLQFVFAAQGNGEQNEYLAYGFAPHQLVEIACALLESAASSLEALLPHLETEEGRRFSLNVIGTARQCEAIIKTSAEANEHRRPDA